MLVVMVVLIGVWLVMCGSVGEGGGFCYGVMLLMRGFFVSCFFSGF